MNDYNIWKLTEKLQRKQLQALNENYDIST